MNNLNNAIGLYWEPERVKSLKIDYALSEDNNERQAIKISLLNLGHRIKENV